MGIYTYLNREDFERCSKVKDEELNEIFQEVREIMPNLYIHENVWITHRWFRKPLETFYYAVYHRLDKRDIAGIEEVHKLNLNFSTRPHVYNYLCGMINGFESGMETINKH